VSAVIAALVPDGVWRRRTRKRRRETTGIDRYQPFPSREKLFFDLDALPQTTTVSRSAPPAPVRVGCCQRVLGRFFSLVDKPPPTNDLDHGLLSISWPSVFTSHTPASLLAPTDSDAAGQYRHLIDFGNALSGGVREKYDSFFPHSPGPLRISLWRMEKLRGSD